MSDASSASDSFFAVLFTPRFSEVNQALLLFRETVSTVSWQAVETANKLSGVHFTALKRGVNETRAVRKFLTPPCFANLI
jgi:hypothetical protein